MIGPGRYDPEVTELRERLGAAGVILIVLEGKKGAGFSCQLRSDLMGRFNLPEVLRHMAKHIEEGTA